MPDINALPVEARRAQPRGAVKLGGVIVPHEAIEVENNAYRAADTFA
jgi:dienelactone hydrolase